MDLNDHFLWKLTYYEIREHAGYVNASRVTYDNGMNQWFPNAE